MAAKKTQDQQEEMDLQAEPRTQMIYAWDNGYLGFINRASGIKYYTGAIVFNGRQRLTRKRFKQAQRAADYAHAVTDRLNRMCNAAATI